HNRQHEAHRLKRFTLLKSLEGRKWKPFFRKRDGAIFGEADQRPYVASIIGDHCARFIRVRLDGDDCLHFNECQGFGVRVEPPLRYEILEQEARNERERWAIPQGRSGHMIEVDGFAVFVDTNKYERRIISALDRGLYEYRERWLASELIRS